MATKKPVKDAQEVKSIADLQADLASKRVDLVNAKRANAAGELSNPKVLGVYRKDIARLLTQINEKESK